MWMGWGRGLEFLVDGVDFVLKEVKEPGAKLGGVCWVGGSIGRSRRFMVEKSIRGWCCWLPMSEE